MNAIELKLQDLSLRLERLEAAQLVPAEECNHKMSHGSDGLYCLKCGLYMPRGKEPSPQITGNPGKSESLAEKFREARKKYWRDETLADIAEFHFQDRIAQARKDGFEEGYKTQFNMAHLKENEAERAIGRAEAIAELREKFETIDIELFTGNNVGVVSDAVMNYLRRKLFGPESNTKL